MTGIHVVLATMATPVLLSPDATALFLTVLVTFGLMLKMFLVALYMGGARIKSGDRPPEDAPGFKSIGESRALQYGFAAAPGPGGGVTPGCDDAQKQQAADRAAAETARFVRIMTNDLENIPAGALQSGVCSLPMCQMDGGHVSPTCQHGGCER